MLNGDGPWDLPLVGYEVMGLHFGSPFVRLDLFAPRLSASIMLQGQFELADPDTSVRELDASEAWEGLSVLFSLRGDRITAATATREAALVVNFASGRRITTGAHPQFENWNVTTRNIN